MVSRRRVIRANAKFYVFIAVALAGITSLLYFVFRADSAVVRDGTIQYETRLPVVIVRDEEVIATENYEKVNFLVPDLQRVETDTPVAEIYRWGYNERVMNDVIDVQNRIEEYELDHGLVTQDLLDLNQVIAEAADRIRAIMDGSADGDTVEAERQLSALMQQKRQLLADNSQRDSQLEALYDQEQQLQDRVNSWREISNAPDAGVVSYYYDGYERVVNADNIRNVSADVIDALLAGTLQVQEDGTERPLYRLVDNFRWYAVLEPSGQVLEFANENTFQVTFSDYPERTFEGRIVGNISEGNTYLYVMEFSEDIGAMVNVRRATATLKAAFEGLIVPEQAVVEHGTEYGVYVLENKVRTFVPVVVRIIKDGEALVDTLDSTRLQAGSRVVW